ncbi:MULTISPECIES: Lrp/AsnC family transcriptional regulator [Bacillus]|uniref:Lrp/AsnC family transcriptional regulator n=1 Tax=Bacillus TaxID=1386 RepID=UPI0022352491
MPNLILDETDKKILSILHEEGRISYTDLGKRVGLSRVAVQTRINNLIEEGIIEKFTAVINPVKVGIHVSVTSLYHMTGPSKLHMHGIFANDQEMEEFLTKRLYPLKGVVSVDCQMLIKRYKSRMGMKL